MKPTKIQKAKEKNRRISLYMGQETTNIPAIGDGSKIIN